MALNTLPAGAFADDAISSDKINLANTHLHLQVQ